MENTTYHFNMYYVLAAHNDEVVCIIIFFDTVLRELLSNNSGFGRTVLYFL